MLQKKRTGCLSRFRQGFSLTELLIVLGLLGLFGALTVPTLFFTRTSNDQSAQANSVIKSLSFAYLTAKTNGLVDENFRAVDLMPQLNYVNVDTGGVTQMEGYQFTDSELTCSSTRPCLTLHDGSRLMLESYSFNGTANNNAIQVLYDVDATYSGSSVDGPSKTVGFFIYYDGRISTRDNCDNPTCTSAGCSSPVSDSDPVWFTGIDRD
ncbi:MAG: prepilin-type N-terminal cleavage/methylation domain-containing protein [Cyanobacteria bacterium P01_H01_bin.74]